MLGSLGDCCHGFYLYKRCHITSDGGCVLLRDVCLPIYVTTSSSIFASLSYFRCLSYPDEDVRGGSTIFAAKIKDLKNPSCFWRSHGVSKYYAVIYFCLAGSDLNICRISMYHDFDVNMTHHLEHVLDPVFIFVAEIRKMYNFGV